MDTESKLHIGTPIKCTNKPKQVQWGIGLTVQADAVKSQSYLLKSWSLKRACSAAGFHFPFRFRCCGTLQGKKKMLMQLMLVYLGSEKGFSHTTMFLAILRILFSSSAFPRCCSFSTNTEEILPLFFMALLVSLLCVILLLQFIFQQCYINHLILEPSKKVLGADAFWGRLGFYGYLCIITCISKQPLEPPDDLLLLTLMLLLVSCPCVWRLFRSFSYRIISRKAERMILYKNVSRRLTIG